MQYCAVCTPVLKISLVSLSGALGFLSLVEISIKVSFISIVMVDTTENAQPNSLVKVFDK